ncbi:hypothetical protein LJC60_01940, partial [Ruminococcaceae bacterium OttesenSCG-928-D13]|nr:hypothetical protein [Ruminococcaceae bacterium OttesenSCG-928-D13]
SGAQVILWDAAGAVYSEAVTVADGAFAFESVPHGSYKLQLTLPGSGETIWAAMSDGELFTISARNAAGFAGLDIVLDMQSRVSGTLALSLNNRPMTYKEEYLPGVKVELVDPQGKTVAEAAVHGDGRYLFENPPIFEQGAYLLRVLVDEVALGEELEVEEIEIELYPGYKC